MAIKNIQELKGERIKIDLTGSEGNAFVLMGYATRIAKQIELDKDQIISEMTSGDYEKLVNVFDKYFGGFVDLYR